MVKYSRQGAGVLTNATARRAGAGDERRVLPGILLVAGFVLLLKGADFLVEGGASLARKFGLGDLVIGLTVVSIGSSSPELVVNVLAGLRGNADLAVGNVLGSNIANILLGLGAGAMVCELKVRKSTVWKEIPFSLLAVLVLAFLANDALLGGHGPSVLTRGDGLVLLSFFVIFIYYVYSLAVRDRALRVEAVARERSMFAASLMTLGGCAGLALGGRWVVEGALFIGRTLGASEALMGLTVVAVGTSLPEIVTSAVAARRNKADIAVGNVVGSNIFNIFWVLGLASLIRPINFSAKLNTDILTLAGATALLSLFIFRGRRHTISRGEGAGFVLAYAAYVLYLLYRG